MKFITNLTHRTLALSTATLSIAAMALTGCASNSTVGPAPVTQVVTAPAQTNHQTYSYDQQVYAPATTTLVEQQHAEATIDAFRGTIQKLSNPRILIYVNRDIIATPVKSATGAASTTTGSATTAASSFNLADKQTTRDIERIVGRPYRYAGATLIDQQTAAALIADLDKQVTDKTGLAQLLKQDSSRRDREVLRQKADIALEVLVSSRSITLPRVTGNESLSIPDIQMTAIRLSDAAIIGQATAADIVNSLPASGLPQLSVQDIVEATALNLMSDITATTK